MNLAPDPHVLLVGDVEGGAADELAITAGPYDHCYTDPPWNSGIARIFRKWAGPELNRSVDINALLDQTLGLIARDVRGWSFVQMGVQKIDYLERRAVELGLTVAGRIDCTQVNDGGSKVEGTAWLLAIQGPEVVGHPIPLVDPSQSWLDLCATVLGQVSQPGQSVVDWYMGQGMVMRVADQLGLRSCGVELNAKRAEEAVARLQSDRDGGRNAWRIS